MTRRVERHARSARRRVPFLWLLLLAAAMLAVFWAGSRLAAPGSLLHGWILGAYKTAVVNLDLDQSEASAHTEPAEAKGGRGQLPCARVAGHVLADLRDDFGMRMLRCPVAIAHAKAAAKRLEFLAAKELHDPILVKGEVGSFLDLCPGRWGCLAVEYSRSGAVRRSWPFRPEEIVRANATSESDHPYEHSLGWSFARGLGTFHLAQYPDGDLLVVFHFIESHPFAGGVARVAPDGRPRWYRKDYSHHWPLVVDNELALVPSMRLRRRRLTYDIGHANASMTVELHCPNAAKIHEDQINVINGRGEIIEQIPVLDAIAQSPYAGALYNTRPCDPTHLNFVHVVGADAQGTPDIAPGDLVVSFRSLSAFGILDKGDRRLKRLVRGGFHMQHGVRHLDGAKFLMFDNLGSDGVHGPSRLLLIDLENNKEKTVFPSEHTPEHLRNWFAFFGGQFDISPDRRRVFLTDIDAGRAFEVRLADGLVLNVLHQVHDLSSLPGFPVTESAWKFRFHGVHYARDHTQAEALRLELVAGEGLVDGWRR